jgi:HEAT repeat protein
MTFDEPGLRLVLLVAVALVLFTGAFLAYALLLHVRHRRLGRRRAALEERWRAFLLETASGSRPEDDGELRIAPEDEVLFLDLVTKYARALDFPERGRLEALAKPFLPALRPLLGEADPLRRARALDTLGELGFEEEEETLVEAVSDESGLVAMLAARALAQRGRPEHLPRILRNLERFENWNTSFLASLLAAFGTDGAPEIRALLLEDEAPARFRFSAARARAAMNDLSSADLAARLLPSEPDPEVQSDLLRLVAKLGRPEHAAVARAFTASPTSHVRAAALQALSALGTEGGDDAERIAAGLDDPSPWVALHAARGLRELGRTDVLERLAGSPSPRASLAAEVLGEG